MTRPARSAWPAAFALLLAGCGAQGTLSTGDKGLLLPEPALLTPGPLALCEEGLPVAPRALGPDPAPSGLCLADAVAVAEPGCEACEAAGRACRCGACGVTRDAPLARVDCEAHADCQPNQVCAAGRCQVRACEPEAAASPCPGGSRCAAVERPRALGDPIVLAADADGRVTAFLVIADGALHRAALEAGGGAFALDPSPALAPAEPYEAGGIAGADLRAEPDGELALVYAAADGRVLARARSKDGGRTFTREGVVVEAPADTPLRSPAFVPGHDDLLAGVGLLACEADADAVRAADLVLCERPRPRGDALCCAGGPCCDATGELEIAGRRATREIQRIAPDGTVAPFLAPADRPALRPGDRGPWLELLALGDPMVLPDAGRGSPERLRIWLTGLGREREGDALHFSVGFAAAAPDLSEPALYPYNPVLDTLIAFTTHLHELAPAAAEGPAHRIGDMLYLVVDDASRSPSLGVARY